MASRVLGWSQTDLDLNPCLIALCPQLWAGDFPLSLSLTFLNFEVVLLILYFPAWLESSFEKESRCFGRFLRYSGSRKRIVLYIKLQKNTQVYPLKTLEHSVSLQKTYPCLVSSAVD